MLRESSPPLSSATAVTASGIGGFSPRRIEAARARLAELGLTQAEWARQNGHNARFVRKILGNRHRCMFGEGHTIAVKLGLKDGPAAPVRHD
ncbi:MAG: DNA-binding protein [Novosphingobium sp.]|nr:DNA-binding protein [Novosphingobium sp.]